MSQGKEATTVHLVTPCLNAADQLDATIESVVSQRGAFHLRYHVQDGASSEPTLGRLRHWEQALASGAVTPGCLSVQFTWNSAPDTGQFEAIARGFAGMEIDPEDFMGFVNAGDLLCPEALARVAALAQARPGVRWVTGAQHMIDATGVSLLYDPLHQLPQEIIAAGLCEGFFWHPVQPCGTFWRRALFDAVGGLNSSLAGAGGWDLWRRLARTAPLHGLDCATGAVRQPRNGPKILDEVFRKEVDALAPEPQRQEAFRRLVSPRPSFLDHQLPDPLGQCKVLDPSSTDAARAEAWRQRVCPDQPWPKITIVTPSFNQGLFLDACMRSVLDQGYPNLEYIVMDGGSTDNSVSIIRSHADRLAHWQSRPDGGQYQAIQDGLNRGTGELMAWLNADDVYQGPSLFKAAMLFLANPQVRWLTGRPSVCDQMGKLAYSSRDLLWSRAGILDMTAPMESLFLAQDAMFWRRELWEEAGPQLDRTFPLAADFELWVRFARVTSLHSVQDILSAFRHHGDQKSVTQKRDYLTQMADVMARELDELCPHRLPGAFFTAPPLLPLVYAEALPALVGTPPPGGFDVVTPAATMQDIAGLREHLQEARSALAGMQSYHEALLLDDLAFYHYVDAIRGDAKCISFDCFDTILYRLSDEPTRLFVELGRRLQDKGLLSRHITPEAFCHLRMVAEEQARKQTQKEHRSAECTIHEIYQHLAAVVKDPGQGVKLEVLTEQDFCHANPMALALLRHCRNQGLKIAILSDNYLTSRQIVSLLQHNGVDMDLVDLVLSSCDVRVSKYEGRLFEVAARKLGIAPQEILHLGDNHEADVRGAELAGVRGVLFPRHNPYTQQVQLRERSLHHMSRQAASLASFRALARRLGGHINRAWRSYYQDGAFLFGPALARYADWVVDQCRAEGITCCLAFMREAQTLMPMIRRSAKAAGYKLEIRPFYVSRHSVNMASMFEVTPKALFDKTGKHRQASARTLLKALDIPDETFREIDPSLMDVPLNDAERMTFTTILARHPAYSRLLDAKARQARQAFMYYALSQFGGHERLAVADIGFRGTIQLFMERIFRKEGVGAHLTGLYFCTQRAAGEVVLEGSDVRSYLGDLGAWNHETQTLYRHPEILEQAVNAVCGTTTGYARSENGAYVPQIEDVSLPFDQLYKRWLIQLGIMSFQKLWLDYAGPRFLDPASPRRIHARCLEEIDREVVYIMQRLFSFPLAEEAARLGSLYHDDNDGTDMGGIICDDDARDRFRRGGMDLLLSAMIYWPHGVVGMEAQGLFEQMFAVKTRFEHP